MLKGSISKQNLLTIEAITSILSEGVINIDKKGIQISGLNESVTMMSDLKLKRMAFKSYKLEKEFKVTADLKELISVIKRVTSNYLEIEIDGKIRITARDKDRQQEFIIPLLNDKDKEMPKTDLEFKKAVELNAVDLRNTIKDMDLVSESSRIGINKKDEIVLSCKGDSGKVIKVIINPSKKGLFKYEGDNDEEITSIYANEFLEVALKGSKISKQVNLFLGDNYPIKLEFCNGIAEITTIISPRVESSEN